MKRSRWVMVSTAVVASLLFVEMLMFGHPGLGYTILFLGMTLLYYPIIGSPFRKPQIDEGAEPRPGRGRFLRGHFFMLALIVLLSISFSLFASSVYSAFGFMLLAWLIPALYLQGAYEKYGWERKGAFFGELALTNYVRPFASIGDSWRFLFSGNKKEKSEDVEQKRRKKKVLFQVFVGVMIAIPVLLFLFILLAVADPLFRETVSGLFEFLADIRLTTIIQHTILVVLLFPLGMSYVWSFHRPYFLFPRDRVRAHNEAKPPLRIPKAVAIPVLLGIVLLYFVYAAIQFSYVMGAAWQGILPNGMSHAEYARTGFFELSFLTVINMAIIAVCMKFVGREGKAGLTIKILTLVMTLLSVVQYVSACIRMGLYIDSYGLTRLRVLVMGLLLFLGIAFILFFIKEFYKKLRIFPMTVAAALCIVLLFTFTVPDRRIAQFNINQALNDRTVNLDLDYLLYNLSDDGVVVVFENRDAIIDSRGKWRVVLDDYVADYLGAPQDENSWKGWNMGSQRLDDLLREIALENQIKPYQYNSYYM